MFTILITDNTENKEKILSILKTCAIDHTVKVVKKSELNHTLFNINGDVVILDDVVINKHFMTSLSSNYDYNVLNLLRTDTIKDVVIRDKRIGKTIQKTDITLNVAFNTNKINNISNIYEYCRISNVPIVFKPNVITFKDTSMIRHRKTHPVIDIPKKSEIRHAKNLQQSIDPKTIKNNDITIKYSFIIPFMYNGDRFPLFKASIECLYNLTKDLPNFEIIVHETAPERKLTDEFINRYGIRYVFSKWDDVFHRSLNLNYIAKHRATGNMFVFLDADLIVTKEWLNELLAFDGVFAMGWGKMKNLTYESTEKYITSLDLSGDIVRTREPSIFGAAGGITIIHKKLFTSIGGWPEEFKGGYGGPDNAMMLKVDRIGIDYDIFSSTVYHLHHNHITYRLPDRNSILNKMRRLSKNQWLSYIYELSDWGDKLTRKGDKLKVLWLNIDRSAKVIRHFDDLLEAFKNVADVDVDVFTHTADTVTNPFIGKIDWTLIKHPIFTDDKINSYDCIITDSMFAYLNEDWSNVNIPVICMIEDLHDGGIPAISTSTQIKFIKDHNFIILNKYQFNQFHTDVSDVVDTQWVPHAVNTDIFKDYRLEKEYDVLSTGAISNLYGTRKFLDETFKDESFYKRIGRPCDSLKKPWPIDDDYAKELNKSLFVVCCGSRLQYPVMKYLEIPACGGIVYGDYFDELGEMGFIPGVNMIVADKSDPIRQIEYLLDHPDILSKLRKNGKALIRERHTTSIRAQELLNIVKEKCKYENTKNETNM